MKIINLKTLSLLSIMIGAPAYAGSSGSTSKEMDDDPDDLDTNLQLKHLRIFRRFLSNGLLCYSNKLTIMGPDNFKEFIVRGRI